MHEVELHAAQKCRQTEDMEGSSDICTFNQLNITITITLNNYIFFFQSLVAKINLAV